MDDLRRFAFFRPFSDLALAGLAAAGRWRDVDAGQVVLEAGDPASDVYFIAEGELRVLTRSSSGYEIILNEMGAGQLFGEIAAIDGGGRSTTVVALTRARLCVIAAEPFMRFALSAPNVSREVMRKLTAIIREQNDRLLELTILPVRPRLVSLLLRLARVQRGGERVVSPPRPHHELAARIGTRREVVSRTLSALQRDGLVVVKRGGFHLPNPALLEAEVEASYRAAAGG